MTESDLKSLIEKKETRQIAGFKSKAGKKFSAKLVLNEDGSTRFVF